jgi:hypothetical protein
MMAYRSSKKQSVDPISPGCNKTIYNSREEAEEMIRHIMETRHVKDLGTYQCPVCGLWHLTSRTDRD